MRGEKLYLSPFMDLFNREIIAYAASLSPNEIVDVMRKRALSRLRRNDKPVQHSDQGWQYQMRSYQQTLREHGVVQSMSRGGNCLDDTALESFFGTLKSELFYLQKFQSVEELPRELRTHIRYYNQDRIALRLRGLSPVEYRARS